jgi:hypothetical protein
MGAIATFVPRWLVRNGRRNRKNGFSRGRLSSSVCHAILEPAVGINGSVKTHENQDGVCVRGTGFGLERSVLCGTTIASPPDGKAMLERAIAALKANEAAALKAFNDEKNKDFRDRDLYVYCFRLPDGNITAYQSPIMIGTDVKELKVPPNNPVGQRAYDAVAKAAEGEIVSFTYDFPKPGTKALAPKETLEVRIGKQACGVSYFKA